MTGHGLCAYNNHGAPAQFMLVNRHDEAWGACFEHLTESLKIMAPQAPLTVNPMFSQWPRESPSPALKATAAAYLAACRAEEQTISAATEDDAVARSMRALDRYLGERKAAGLPTVTEYGMDEFIDWAEADAAG